MIQTAIQLKAKVRNLSGGDSKKAQVLIRNYVMERFLERITLSKYRDNFILKGGMLVSAVMGLDTRATMDIDTTVKSINLDIETASKIINEIVSIEVEDGMSFVVTKASDIMEDFDYPGIRFMIEGHMDNLKQMIKIDISTGDVITPEAVLYSYKLMFEDRTIPLYSYNLETLLAEKIETVIARGTANTRMRDFYDIHVLWQQEKDSINTDLLKQALYFTSKKRETLEMLEIGSGILDEINNSSSMMHDWNNFRESNYFVGDLTWTTVVESTTNLYNLCKFNKS